MGRQVRILHGTSRIFGSPAAYAGATDPGRVRRCNEDSLLVLPETGLFAVADGLGGLDAGDVASSTALAHLHDLSSSPNALGGGETTAQLEAMIAAVNSRTYAHRMALGKNMATTLALVQFGGDSAFAAHVGDSRIYHWHNSTLTRVTSDHSLVNELYEQGALTASQAAHSPQRHVITRAVGAEPTVLPSIKPISVAHGDLLLLCTDGLTSMVTDEAIAACFEANSTNIEHLIEQLVHRANDAGGHDNITVVAVAL
jgi:PPM family protein phosphatase